MTETVVTEMAEELRQALLARGLDPTDPPKGRPPNLRQAFAEYRRRGGKTYTNADDLWLALLAETSLGSLD